MEIFLFWLIGAIVVGVIASNRGRSGIGFFFLSILLSPLLGLILAVALPSKVVRSATGEEITPQTHIRCPDCRELVRRDAVKCKHCGSALTPTPFVSAVTPEKRAAYEAERKKVSTIFVVVVLGVIGLIALMAAMAK